MRTDIYLFQLDIPTAKKMWSLNKYWLINKDTGVKKSKLEFFLKYRETDALCPWRRTSYKQTKI